ncbi:outer membrane beta-barrel protein [Roseomonas sp. HJA6]|uniref:Outer membrane beta-barrel protein n=1 Tax=Roseomonas alba TaxID=2846776 RepID=A0ABS7A8F9_9PROT|nr:OmpW family outer membrane protein [Neoroseomonas alba]MBW6398572.1 outer membrane beta-barrel protein [Neoroseomonas alba]
MIRMSSLLAGAVALGLLAARPAAAQNGIRGNETGDVMIGLSVIGIVPVNGGSVNGIGGTPEASNAVTGQIDFTYFMTPNFSVNLIAATARHDLQISDSRLGTLDLGHVWSLPPTLTVQYHPLLTSRFSPYLGVGVNYTVFYGEGGSYSRPVTKVDVQNALGFALNGGLDIELSPHWLLNFDVKWIYMTPDVTVQAGSRRIHATADVDPFVFGAGLRYRF